MLYAHIGKVRVTCCVYTLEGLGLHVVCTHWQGQGYMLCAYIGRVRVTCCDYILEGLGLHALCTHWKG